MAKGVTKLLGLAQRHARDSERTFAVQNSGVELATSTSKSRDLTIHSSRICVAGWPGSGVRGRFMLYVFVYKIDGIIGPGGTVDTTRGPVVRDAITRSIVALDQLDDAVGVHEWFNLAGEEVDPYSVLRSDDEEEILEVVSQINDLLQAQGLGYLGFDEFDTLSDLIEHHCVLEWCSESLKVELVDLRRRYAALVSALSEEWARG